MALTFQQYRFLFWVMLLHTVCAGWVIDRNIPGYYLFGPVLVFYLGFFRVRAMQGQLTSYPLALRLVTYAVLAAGCFWFAVEIPYGKQIIAAQWLVGWMACMHFLSRSITPEQVLPAGTLNGVYEASIDQQFSVTTGIILLYGACFCSITSWDIPEILPFGVAAFTCALFFRARAKKVPPTVYPLALRIYAYAMLAAGAIGFSYKTYFSQVFLLTPLILGIGVMLYFLVLLDAKRRFDAQRITLTDTPKQLVDWIERYFPLPLSRKFAAIAAAMRALEQGQGSEQARHAAEQAALAWAPPAGVALRFINNLATEGPWKDIPYQVLSQGLAIEAAVLRALELGQDDATAVAAGRKMGIAWAPHAGQHSTTSK
jgi:hypothetical protein